MRQKRGSDLLLDLTAARVSTGAFGPTDCLVLNTTFHFIDWGGWRELSVLFKGAYFLHFCCIPRFQIAYLHFPILINTQSQTGFSEFSICLNLKWDEICALLGYYATSSSNPLPTFRDNVSVPSLRVKNSKKQNFSSFYPRISWPLKMGAILCPETSVKDYHSMLRNTPEERRSHRHRGGSLRSLQRALPRKCQNNTINYITTVSFPITCSLISLSYDAGRLITSLDKLRINVAKVCTDIWMSVLKCCQ